MPLRENISNVVEAVSTELPQVCKPVVLHFSRVQIWMRSTKGDVRVKMGVSVVSSGHSTVRSCIEGPCYTLYVHLLILP